MSNKYLNMLGLAHRAGKCTTGEESIIKDIRMQRAKLVILASDTGPQTRKKIIDKCNFYKVPYKIAADRETLSHAIGQSQRVAIAILDAGFAAKITSLLG